MVDMRARLAPVADSEPARRGRRHDLAIVEAELLAGRSLLETITDPATGEVRPVVIATDKGGPFR
jgi:hypothetical protein